ncbi:MAG: TIGR02996 domain-containing protein [Zavarzinella sp.]
MSEEEALLKAIQLSPADTTVRLVYADWLEDRGDPRAEFLRLQNQLAKVLDRLQHVRAGLSREWIQTVEVCRDVVLHSFTPENRRAVTKIVRLHSAMMMEEIRDLFAQLPAVILKNQSLVKAERVRQELEKVAVVTIEPSTD